MAAVIAGYWCSILTAQELHSKTIERIFPKRMNRKKRRGRSLCHGVWSETFFFLYASRPLPDSPKNLSCTESAYEDAAIGISSAEPVEVLKNAVTL